MLYQCKSYSWELNYQIYTDISELSDYVRDMQQLDSSINRDVSRGLMLTKFKGFSILIYFILSQRAYNLITITYLIADSIQQIQKIGFLVYYLDLNQLFISLASSFQYVLIYAGVFFMLQAKFSLKYKTALAFGLKNSLQNLKFETIFAFSSELKNK